MTETPIPVSDAGGLVTELLRSAQNEVIFVAPYIKVHTLRSLISKFSDSVEKFICVTRFLPEDIASGVCDLEIFDLIENNSGWQLLIQPHLHAKYYRASNSVLVGSANLTSRALGWSKTPNVELLVELSLDYPGLKDWEKQLLDSTYPANRELIDQIRAEAERLLSSKTQIPNPDFDKDETSEDSKAWFPECPVPDRLWDVYSRANIASMVTSAKEGALNDLSALSPPSGLSKEVFNAFIIGILKHMPIIEEIDELSKNGLSDSQAIVYLEKTYGSETEFTHEEMWRILKQWLTYFFPADYRLETVQEVLVKGKRLDR